MICDGETKQAVKRNRYLLKKRQGSNKHPEEYREYNYQTDKVKKVIKQGKAK